MTRIEEEKKTVRQMIEIYCHGKKHEHKRLLSHVEVCEECSALLDYAYQRLDHCKFGEKKPTCKKCPIHCYKPAMKEKMREAMRYAGPRMMWYHPIAAIKHIIREIK
ncbi:MAG: nitrous oxide-stimulated promoter family protein [Paludibacteraceae bacterium]|nr:nitrous oxide-stimulated promoter family protein [Paludibacteraceae bacterium]